MNFPRPRTVVRVIIYGVVSWLLLAGAYLALPSPPPSDVLSSARLQSGRSLTRVFEVAAFFPYNDQLQAVRNARRGAYFILDFELIRPVQGQHDDDEGNPTNSNATLTLEIRGKNKFGTTIPLSPFDDLPPGSFPSDGITLSDPLFIHSRLANQYSIVPPWVAPGDSALLQSWLDFAATDIPLRIRRVPVDKTVEIWPESSDWIRPLPKPGAVLIPLITFKLSNDLSSNPVITFSPSRTSFSPSSFYHARLVLLAMLVPPAVLAIGSALILLKIATITFQLVVVLTKAVSMVLGGGALCAIAAWLWMGRPNAARVRESLSVLWESRRNSDENENGVQLTATSVPESLIDIEAQNPEQHDKSAQGHNGQTSTHEALIDTSEVISPSPPVQDTTAT